MATFRQIFLVFAKIGAFTIGGGYAMLPLIKNELVSRGWMEEDDFADITALAQSAPGLLAVNISIFAGYRLRGTAGSIVATIGSILPSFLIILTIAAAFSGYQDNPTVVSIFKGIRPVVVALIAVPVIDMAKQSGKKWWAWVMSAVVMVLVAFLNISPMIILPVVIAASAAVTYRRKS